MTTLTVCGVEVPLEATTLDGFRRWALTLEDRSLRIHYSRGDVVVEMSPQNLRFHEPIVAAINTVLYALARTADVGRYFLPPTWFTHKATELSTEPDGCFASWSRFDDETVRIEPEREIELIGCPDMVLEVVSKSSRRKDLVENVGAYARAGVNEYWIVDPARAPIALRILERTGAGELVDVPSTSDGWCASATWDRAFRLVELNDRAGLASFVLEVRPRDPR